MFDSSVFTYISTEVGADPEFTHGIVGDGRKELKAATDLVKHLGDSRFSVIAFAEYLSCVHDTAAETDKVMLAALYYIQSQAEDPDRPHSMLARRIIDVLHHYGYAGVAFTDPT